MQERILELFPLSEVVHQRGRWLLVDVLTDGQYTGVGSSAGHYYRARHLVEMDYTLSPKCPCGPCPWYLEREHDHPFLLCFSHFQSFDL